jgi:DNA repair ATPase RecN
MSFNKYKVNNLRNFLTHLSDYHDIKDFDKMNKQQLVNEINDRFKIEGSGLYVIGGSRNSGLIQALEAKKEITKESFKKIKNPSKYLIRKYGQQEEQPASKTKPKKKKEPEYEQPTFEPSNYSIHKEAVDKVAHEYEKHGWDVEHLKENPKKIFNEDEEIEFNVGKAPKKKAPKAKEHIPTEIEEERIELAKQKDLERKQKELERLESLKSQIPECRKLIQEENDMYYKVLEQVRQNKERRKKKDKEEYEQKVIQKHRSNLKKIKDKFSNLFQYAKQHKLDENNLNDIYKHVRMTVNKL